MAVRTYSLKKQGRNYKVSAHFSLGEFASRDGADKVLVSDELLAKLEELRAYLGGDGVATVGINSGYRTVSYNRSINGASGSRHTKGDAADVVCKQKGKRVSGKLICALCQTLGFKGVALNKGSGYSVHLDMRPSGTYRGDERKGYSNNVGGDFYKYFGITKAQVEALRYVPPKEEKPVAKPVEKPVEKPAEKVEEKKMTQNEFNQMMNQWMAERAAKEPDEWSAEARKWAEENGIIVGTGAGYSYESYCTREQMVMFLYRLAEMLKK